ncbi:MAG: hypothetical protein M1383_03235 [Patescibacteria group bacterium]|nr:hypothetical protein [Patescibacteria group bacterium]
MPENESLENFLKMAKQREAEAANRPIEEARQKTQTIIKKIEQSAPEHARLMSEDESATNIVKGMGKEVVSAENQLKSIQAERAALDTDPKYEPLRKHPDLLAQALASFQEREQAIREGLGQKQEALAEAKTKQAEIRGQAQAVAAEARQYLGEKEVPQKRLDKVWEYVEHERELDQRVSHWDPPRGIGSHEADEYIYNIIQRENKGEMQILLDGKEDNQYWRALFGKSLDGGYFDEPVIQPKLYNNFAVGVADKINRAISEKKFYGRGYGPEQPLTDEQVEAIKNGKVSVTYKGKTISVWEAGKPAPLMAEQKPAIFAELTQNEQAIAEAAVKDPQKTKESLLKELKMSEYSPEADEYFRGQAALEDAEFNKRKLEEKLPDLEANMRQLAEQEAAKQVEITVLEKLKKEVSEYPGLANLALNLKNQEKNLSDYTIPAYQSNVERAKQRREVLPKRAKILGGGPKDITADADAAVRIAEAEEQLRSANQQLSETKYQLEIAEEQLATKKEAVLKLDAGAIDTNGRLVLDEYQAGNKVTIAQNELKKIQLAKERTQKVREQWEKGKFLNLSSQEAQMVVPETGGSMLDQMASTVASRMENRFGPYSNWDKLPETTWDIKRGELFIEDYHFGEPILGRADWDWGKLAKSEQLQSLFAEKIRQQLAKKFGKEVGEVKIRMA